MAGNNNRAQKNTVRVALATAATVATLLGAQALAFAGKSDFAEAAQSLDPVVVVIPATSTLSQPTVVVTAPATNTREKQPVIASATNVPTTTTSRVAAAPTQPQPRTRSSR
jgi:hypothetical protein